MLCYINKYSNNIILCFLIFYYLMFSHIIFSYIFLCYLKLYYIIFSIKIDQIIDKNGLKLTCTLNPS